MSALVLTALSGMSADGAIDPENLIWIVAIILMSLIGGIASKVKDRMERTRQAPSEPRPKPPTAPRPTRQRTARPPARPTPARARPAAHPARPQPTEPRAKPLPTRPRVVLRVEPKTRGRALSQRQPIETLLVPAPDKATRETPVPTVPAKLAARVEKLTPTEMRRAVVLSEILRKPLALRDLEP